MPLNKRLSNRRPVLTSYFQAKCRRGSLRFTVSKKRKAKTETDNLHPNLFLNTIISRKKYEKL